MKRNSKYISECCNERLENTDGGYKCPKCNKQYKEISTIVKEYITDEEGNVFPISDTIIVETE